MSVLPLGRATVLVYRSPAWEPTPFRIRVTGPPAGPRSKKQILLEKIIELEATASADEFETEAGEGLVEIFANDSLVARRSFHVGPGANWTRYFMTDTTKIV